MIRFVASAALLLSACAARPDEPDPPVTLEATINPSAVTGGFKAPPTLRISLVGGAKGAAVATEGLSLKVTKGDKKVTVTLSLPEVKDGKGRLVVPSADRLAV